MLEFLESRINLARARICQSFDPIQANEFMINSYNDAWLIGSNNPEMELGALALNEPSVLDSFYEGASSHCYWENQISLDYSETQLCA